MTTLVKTNRIESIDLLRGIVMVIMALDHVRDYFHADAFIFDPLDLDKTSVALFFTRWITHFCAPVFVFLAGTSAFMVGERKGKKELSAFLLKRGLWLVFLELTVVNFAWFFNIHFTLVLLVVIWALGISMIVLAGLIHLPKKMILIIGLLLVAGHNLLDNVHVDGNGLDAIGWALLHQFQFFGFENFSLFVGYPLLPWIGTMALGYCFGSLYTLEPTVRKQYLIKLGGAALLLFIVIRATNFYGDPSLWSVQSSPVFTILSFLNVSKYPPSLLYLLMTLGCAILFLAFVEGVLGKLNRAFVTIGRVPMFYYLLHLYLIHGLAIIAAMATGFGFSSMVNFESWVTMRESLVGYGFDLWVTYGVWIFVVLTLYPLCKWFDRYKSAHREKWWLSYL
ncbi:MAG TPA: heparan-alpha-glucosaminide N-acetyltransferase domain-containing protein [Chryseolinea sp.]|nr:heparan-alpha-glucosaminide N-acetyltransferase domain-containing protein [Chryseolinea sp.]HPH46793.1 heparan-alpha-glucosaminide N-acetyltransferase domain-containing protein [Chryseolinea sp.]